MFIMYFKAAAIVVKPAAGAEKIIFIAGNGNSWGVCGLLAGRFYRCRFGLLCFAWPFGFFNAGGLPGKRLTRTYCSLVTHCRLSMCRWLVLPSLKMTLAAFEGLGRKRLAISVAIPHSLAVPFSCMRSLAACPGLQINDLGWPLWNTVPCMVTV